MKEKKEWEPTKSKCHGHNIWFPIKNQTLCVFCGDRCHATPRSSSSLACQQLKLSKRKLISVHFVVWACECECECEWVRWVICMPYWGSGCNRDYANKAWKLIVEANCKLQMTTTMSTLISECKQWAVSALWVFAIRLQLQLISRESIQVFFTNFDNFQQFAAIAMQILHSLCRSLPLSLSPCVCVCV